MRRIMRRGNLYKMFDNIKTCCYKLIIMKFNQLVCVEFANYSPFVYRIVSDNPITFEKGCSIF
jgi:hypothetical protein